MTQPSETDTQHQGTLWMKELEGSLQAPFMPRIPADFMRADPQDVQELAQAMAGDPAHVQQRLATGRHCYIGWVEGRLATYGWVTFDEEGIGELGLRIRLLAGEAYIWGCETLPAYRGQRLYPALLTYMLDQLKRAGIHRVWIGADADNLASQKGFILAGFQPVADVMLTRAETTYRQWIRGHAGASEQAIADAHRALFGEDHV
jgi:RimJ/RimL family protein N-acetyltransferase